MKNLKEYLAESKKTYGFKIKVAGPLPEGFEQKVQSHLGKYSCAKFSKVAETPIQKIALEFAELSNIEVTIFEAECQYPATPQEIHMCVRNATGVADTHLRVRNANDPFESLVAPTDEPSGEALLNDPNYKEADSVKSSEFFGDDYNKSFLKDLAKVSKERKKAEGVGEYKLPKTKEDKAGLNSAVGSK